MRRAQPFALAHLTIGRCQASRCGHRLPDFDFRRASANHTARHLRIEYGSDLPSAIERTATNPGRPFATRTTNPSSPGLVRSRAVVSGTPDAWDGELVRKWLESRVQAARIEQAAADRRGYEARDDYDKAAAEEWVCRTLTTADRSDDRAAFAALLKALIAQDEYRVTGVHDDRRFDRYVRADLRKIVKMTKANHGFANMLRYQG
jgi:hypothetical protein